MKGRATAYLYVGLAAVLWGSNGVIVNLVEQTPLTLTFFRVLLGGLTLSAAAAGRLQALGARGKMRRFVALGALLALGWILLFQSMKLIPIGSAVLLNYMAPIFVALIAPITLKERVEKRTLTALTLSATGAILICYRGLQTRDINPLGAAAGLSAAIAYAAFIILSKRALEDADAITTALYSYLVAAAILSPTLIWAKLPLDAFSWLLLLLMGALNTGLAVTLYFIGLSRLKAHEAAIMTYLEPVSAIIFGYLILSQQPTVHMLVGGALILSAQYVLMSPGQSNPQ